jgi:hypothetical protein
MAPVYSRPSMVWSNSRLVIPGLNFIPISGLSFILFFLYDNYIPGIGVRPFDLAGFAVIFVMLIVGIYREGIKLCSSLGSLLFSVVGIGCISIYLMFRPDQWRAHVGIILGFIVFFYYRSLVRPGDAVRWLRGLLLISVGAFFGQTIYYFVSGGVLDPYSFLKAN